MFTRLDAFHVVMLWPLLIVTVNRYKRKESFKKRHYDDDGNKNELIGSAKLCEYRKNLKGHTKKILEHMMHVI